MVFLHDKFNGSLDRKISAKEIWNHLTEMYDLNALVCYLLDYCAVVSCGLFAGNHSNVMIAYYCGSYMHNELILYFAVYNIDLLAYNR